MGQIPIDELLKQCNSIYKLVVIAAKRAKELAGGAPKFVETDLKKITSIALEEIRQGKVLYKAKEEEEAKGERKAKRRGAKEASAARSTHARETKKKA